MKKMKKKGYAAGGAAKPDFLDIDKDGNKTESMKAASADKKGMYGGGMSMKKKGMSKGGANMKKKGMANGGAMMKKKGMAKGGAQMKKKGMANGGAMMKKKGMAKGGLKKKAYAKGGRVAMYNVGGMVKSSGELNTGIARAKNTYK